MSSGKKVNLALSDLDAMGGLDDLVAGGGLAALEGGRDAFAAPEGDDPLAGVDYANLSNEEAVKEEASAVLLAFKARAKREQERFALATDSEYWVGVCFQTREQKEHWLRSVKLLHAGDKYIDGRLLAQRMGVEQPAADVPYNVTARPDAKFAALVKP